MTKQLFGLVLLSIAMLALGQHQSWSWEEYVSANDGLAVTLPATPVPQRDPTNPDINVYTLILVGGSGSAYAS